MRQEKSNTPRLRVCNWKDVNQSKKVESKAVLKISKSFDKHEIGGQVNCLLVGI